LIFLQDRLLPLLPFSDRPILLFDLDQLQHVLSGHLSLIIRRMTGIQRSKRICTIAHDEDPRVENLKVVVLEVVGSFLVGRVRDCGFEGG
jgi:hypothetical protein